MQNIVQRTSARVRLRNRMFGLRIMIQLTIFMLFMNSYLTLILLLQNCHIFSAEPKYCPPLTAEESPRESQFETKSNFIQLVFTTIFYPNIKLFLILVSHKPIQTWLLKSGPRSGDSFVMLRLPWPSSSLVFVNKIICPFSPIMNCTRNSQTNHILISGSVILDND